MANPDHSANVLDTLKSIDEDLGIKMNDQRSSIVQRQMMKDCDIKQRIYKNYEG